MIRPAFTLLSLLAACTPRDASPPSSSDSTHAVAPSTSDTTVAGAAALVTAYYAAISRKDYAGAYRLWRGAGAASGKSLDEFRRGVADTDSVRAVTGTPGRMEPAAGNRYVEIPVRVTAYVAGGATRAFVGTFTMRRAVVPGATDEERLWRIESAKLTPTMRGFLTHDP